LFKIESGIKEVEEAHRFDTGALEAYLREQRDEIGDLAGPLVVHQFRGGQSNPTYHLNDGASQWVLRRKPPGTLVASAHAVDREFRVLKALGQTDVPVPKVRVLCEDPAVIGTIFYVMDVIPGRILTDQTLPDLSPEDRAGIYDSKISTLAKLHAVDHEAIGLGDYGKPGNYYARQIKTWTRQYQSATALDPIPAMERLAEWLPENIPADDAVSIAHGDYGLNNMVIHPTEPRVAAILDWELSTIGHPLADLTYHLSARRTPSSPFHALSDSDLRERGIPTEAEYVARYCELSGRSEIKDYEFYIAFHLFRSAGIMRGIAGRVQAGTAAGEGALEVGRLAAPLAEASLELAKKLGA
jgi:aminoglycoside phosphotransferase (APT) family kinase protein